MKVNALIVACLTTAAYSAPVDIPGRQEQDSVQAADRANIHRSGDFDGRKDSVSGQHKPVMGAGSPTRPLRDDVRNPDGSERLGSRSVDDIPPEESNGHTNPKRPGGVNTRDVEPQELDGRHNLVIGGHPPSRTVPGDAEHPGVPGRLGSRSVDDVQPEESNGHTNPKRPGSVNTRDVEPQELDGQHNTIKDGESPSRLLHDEVKNSGRLGSRAVDAVDPEETNIGGGHPKRPGQLNNRDVKPQEEEVDGQRKPVMDGSRLLHDDIKHPGDAGRLNSRDVEPKEMEDGKHNNAILEAAGSGPHSHTFQEGVKTPAHGGRVNSRAVADDKPTTFDAAGEFKDGEFHGGANFKDGKDDKKKHE